MRLIDALIDFSLFLFSFIIPKKKNTVLFGAADGSAFRGNPKYILLYLRTNSENYAICWITKNKILCGELKARGIPVVYKYSTSALWSILRSQFLIIDSTPKDVFYFGEFIIGRFRVIQTWHGIGFKEIGLPAIKRGRSSKADSRLSSHSLYNLLKYWVAKTAVFNYEMIIATSEETRQHFAKMFENQNVVVTGYPRNDIFYRPELAYKDYKKLLGLDRFEEIILYAPTFRDHYGRTKPFSDDFLTVLDNYLKRTNKVLLLKKHIYDKSIELRTNLENIIDVTSEVDDIQDLLMTIDVLITDYSSVSFDYILKGGAIIYYPYDFDTYREDCRDLLYDYFEELPGPFAYSEDDLLPLLKNTDKWRHDKEFERKNRRFIEKFYSQQDGDSSRRVLEYLKANP